MSSAGQRTYSEGAYDIRHAKDNAETQLVWWPHMIELQWNRGPDDLATYMDHSRSRGMLLAFETGSDKPIGHVAAVVNENRTGWVAMFIVNAQYRGLRLGAALWDAMMRDFEAAGTEYVGLDAVPEQRLTYGRRGFVESKNGVVKVMIHPLQEPSQTKHASEYNAKLWPLQKVSSDVLAQYEQKYTGFHRPGLWANLSSRKDVVGLVAGGLDLPSAVNDIHGIVTLRRAPNGVRLSPLYADTAIIAENLLSAIMAEATAEYIRRFPMQDFPLHDANIASLLAQAGVCTEMWSGNADAEALFAKHGWTEVARFHRMWLNDKATPEQSKGGSASKGLYAVFDAAIG